MSGWVLKVGSPVGPASSAQTATATCPTGKSVLGGGFIVNANGHENEIAISKSYPSATRTWTVVAKPMPDSTRSFTLTAYAICATVL